jgi:hypothetical protein
MKDLVESVPQYALIPEAATLDAWSAQEWTNGVQIDELNEFDTLVVETMHHTYEITVINPATAEVLIRGGEFFAEKTPAVIVGASMRHSFLKPRSIYPGFSVELWSGDRRIITSRVRRVVREAVLEPNLK